MATREQLVRRLPGDERAATAERVREPARIAGLLGAITFPPLLVNVALPGVGGLFSSAILEVDSGSRRILLDGLSPADGHARIAPGSVLHIHSKLRGVQLDFATQIVAVQDREQLPAYLARLPSCVRYYQRRKHFRMRTGHLHDYSAVVLGPAAGSLRGRVADISAGGLKIIFPRDLDFEPGQVIADCHLDVFGQQQLACSIELVHLSTSPLTGELVAGARFLHAEAQGKERLQRLLTRLQREHLRHRLPG